VRIKRNTARVPPVDREGRVLLLIGRGLCFRSEPFWLSIGGALERGETLAQAAARELHEEAGITVDPGGLGGPLGTSVIEFSKFGMLPVTQYQTYFVVGVDDAAVSFARQGAVERRCIEGHAWLRAEGLATRPERISDPELPRLMRAAVTAAEWPGQCDL
jgi:8-oxo-dGTP pyrophosphatase MutT (NUDIX family)